MNLVFAAPHGLSMVSIFYLDHKPCARYFEIRPSSINAKMLLESTLKGIALLTFLGSNKSQLSFVSPKDCANLLMYPHQATQCDRGSWVWLRHGGRYHNNLGFVMGMDGDNAKSIWVPRIPLDGNFRPHPPAALFDHDAIKDVKGTRAVRHGRGFYKFCGKTYTQDGFLLQSVNRLYLDIIGVLPSEKELAFFSQSHDREVLQAVQAVQSRVDYNVFDKVRVHSGPLQGTLAHVVSIKDADVVTMETLLETIVIDVSQEDICRAFSCGDTVTVIRGEYQGEEGFIIDVHGTLVTLYIARFSSARRESCNQFKIEARYFSLQNITILFDFHDLGE
jgi:ribosomal protein L24